MVRRILIPVTIDPGPDHAQGSNSWSEGFDAKGVRWGPLYELDRWLYRDGRPHAMARKLNRGWAALAGSGWAPKRLSRLEVTGRRSGAVISFPVVLADYAGQEYLASMLGDQANWVRNVRAAQGRAVLKHGLRQGIMLSEIPPDERAPILRRYLEVAPGARPHVPIDRSAPLDEFERIAPQFPVFKISRRP